MLIKLNIKKEESNNLNETATKRFDVFPAFNTEYNNPILAKQAIERYSNYASSLYKFDNLFGDELFDDDSNYDFNQLHHTLTNNHEFMLNVLEKSPYLTRIIGPKLKASQDFILELMLRYGPSALEIADTKIKKQPRMQIARDLSDNNAIFEIEKIPLFFFSKKKYVDFLRKIIKKRLLLSVDKINTLEDAVDAKRTIPSDINNYKCAINDRVKKAKSLTKEEIESLISQRKVDNITYNSILDKLYSTIDKS